MKIAGVIERKNMNITGFVSVMIIYSSRISEYFKTQQHVYAGLLEAER
jgi:hypothetical protein